MSETENPTPIEKKERANYNVSSERFVIVWQAAKTVEEVAKELNMPKANAAARAASYRKKGIDLKRMSTGRGRVGLDKAKLNALITRVAG